MYELYRQQVIDASIDRVWSFISKPANLDKITPDDMAFEIVTETPEQMHEGLIVEYRVTIPIVGQTTWVSEIKHIVDKKQFVDEQKIGPYSLWYHYHAVESVPDGTKMIDRVSYKPPFGPVGRLANYFIIRPKLEQIFAFRRSAITEHFAD